MRMAAGIGDVDIVAVRKVVGVVVVVGLRRRSV